jgi:two-component system sensor histidine kinase AdeS
VTSPGDQREDEGRRSAHDLLQSVAIMQALIGTLRATDAVAPAARGLVDQLQREVRMIADVCERQLDVGKVLHEVDLAAVVVEVVERSQLTYGGQIAVDAVQAVIEGDPVEWHRCLYNLVENACRAASDDGKVEVRLSVGEGSIRIAVGDSGPGFGEAVAGRASLGLTTVTRVVEGHSGHLELRESPLGGAQLTIVVPQQA